MVLYLSSTIKTLGLSEYQILIAGLILASILGAAIAIVTGTMHIFFTQRLSSPNLNNITPFQLRTLQLPLSKKSVFESSLASLHSLNAGILQQDFNIGIIRAVTRTSWASWGEEIEIKLSQTNDGATLVNVKSSPKLKITPIDYGKNIDNVEKILVFLKT